MNRDDVFQVQAEALKKSREAEHQAATKLLQQAAADFKALGIQPYRLSALSYSGRGPRVKTNLVGWFLKTDKTVAMDEAGNYYIMRVEGSLKERLFGASPAPSLAPLVVGRGGRDGESIDLPELIAMRKENPVQP